MRDSELFDDAVADLFQPIAQKLNLPLFKIKDGVYEIPSPRFILRIRLDTGHQRGLNVTLRPASLARFDENGPTAAYGIGNFVRFYGEKWDQAQAIIVTDEDFVKQAQLFALATERVGVPYLLGQGKDYDAIKEMVRKRSEPEVEKIKQMMRNIKRNMPSVREEWPVIIPPEKGEKISYAQEIQIPGLHFLGELDGEREQKFKEQLIEFFKRDRSVKTAYLARIIGDGFPAGAALCLLAQFGPDKGLVGKIGEIFGHVFRVEERLDIIFLDDRQVAEIAKVCPAFFTA